MGANLVDLQRNIWVQLEFRLYKVNKSGPLTSDSW